MKKNICIILSLLLYTIGMQAEVFFFGDKMKKCEQTGLFNKCF